LLPPDSGFRHGVDDVKTEASSADLRLRPPVFETSSGSPLQLGAHLASDGVNFALFSRHASRVWLLLFDGVEADLPYQTIELDRAHHKTGDIWHVRLLGAGRGLIYAYRVDGPFLPEKGHRFDPSKVLLDPYATALTSPKRLDFGMFCGTDAPSDMATSCLESPAIVKCLVTENGFDWGDDRPLHHAWSDLVIYEAHVRGLSIDASAGSKAPGTFLGVIEKIPHLKSLGVNAIELMPLQAFNPAEVTLRNPETGKRLSNYWGYNTIAFFAPYEGYGSRSYPGCQVDEFKAMVKALHSAGIEVLLDVVFNHTAEGNETGPTLSFRGLDNRIYYILEDDRHFYKNYSGCGNTVNCSHPVVRNFILDCLRYWVVEMHVDGFRFDLASILGRDQNGNLVPNPPLLEQIAEDPILRDVKLIAEAWDAGGAYLVGRFPGERWSEWNGVFRDDVRRYWRGDPGMAGPFASRLCGSADIYEHSGKAPLHSINFVTCHDGFTLNDLVSYDSKHNAANGEDSRDGCNDNHSANYGVEGPSDDPFVAQTRDRQIKNFLATLFLARGVPMLLGGDEFRRTQWGNNNAYCQDNPISWIDWSLAERNHETVRFVRELIQLRRCFSVLSSERFYRPDEIDWFNPEGHAPDWTKEQALGCVMHSRDDGQRLCLLTNPSEASRVFRIPEAPRARRWRRLLDTSMSAPHEICQPDSAVAVLSEGGILVRERSLVLLVAGGSLEQRSIS
jgi:isoamylase